MASTVTNYSNQINTNYPVPGIDNDTQGFRDNFSRIASAFDTVGKEITDIQANAVNLSATNNFGDNIIRQATFQDCSVRVENVGTVAPTTATINYTLGSYQICTLAPGFNGTFQVDFWPPADKCGTIRIQMTPSSTATVTINFSNVDYSNTSLPVTYNQINPIVWELWSPDSGTTIFATEILK